MAVFPTPCASTIDTHSRCEYVTTTALVITLVFSLPPNSDCQPPLEAH
ncbi:MAG: hypothetical protein GFH27_549301n73 [Chloroflexi bacterium AL-W]|nr:hypothetical protein [Chloroflexi bacterium AL-N1]NOK68266.1 hypothetical protein [Chloroflexi bacterium AL-N10]NOK73912.1 hypothetical protein [Chloroflexi bacterium AL-N5]NOK82880.1 hypothetical protein [Chloroflexi bacterium AL-W]NOK90402.1 hypothetical protein [Chloroflexi bacterium AL-N15]